jgi:hypothetical protein
MSKTKEETSQYMYSFKSEFASENGNILKNEADEVEINDNIGIINKYKDNKKISSNKITKKELEKYKETQNINLNDIVPVITQMSPFISLGKIPSPNKKQQSPTPTPTTLKKSKTTLKNNVSNTVIPKIINDKNTKQIKRKSPKKT